MTGARETSASEPAAPLEPMTIGRERQTRVGSRSRLLGRLTSLICGFTADEGRSCALIPRQRGGLLSSTGARVVDRIRQGTVQAAGSWKCQMTSDGRPSAARAAVGR